MLIKSFTYLQDSADYSSAVEPKLVSSLDTLVERQVRHIQLREALEGNLGTSSVLNVPPSSLHKCIA